MSTEQIQDLDWADSDLTPEQVADEINKVGGTIERIMTKWHAKLEEVRALIVRLKEVHAEEIADAENINSQQAERITYLEGVLGEVTADLTRVKGAVPTVQHNVIELTLKKLERV